MDHRGCTHVILSERLCVCVCVCVCVQADVGELTGFYASLMQQVNRVLQPVHT